SEPDAAQRGDVHRPAHREVGNGELQVFDETADHPLQAQKTHPAELSDDPWNARHIQRQQSSADMVVHLEQDCRTAGLRSLQPPAAISAGYTATDHRDVDPLWIVTRTGCRHVQPRLVFEASAYVERLGTPGATVTRPRKAARTDVGVRRRCASI